MKFEDLGIDPIILRRIKKEGFQKPTEIQEKCIPAIKKGKDIVGQSVTGSGKTVAFGIPLIEKTFSKKGIQSLVLTPTRELCMQVKEVFDDFGKEKGLRTTAIYGGVDIRKQIHDLKTSELVVATPGRLLDHLNRNSINLNSVKYLVLDEVDRMFDMGFRDDVDKIISKVPKNRQTLLFSATIPNNVQSVVKKYLKSPLILKAQIKIDKSKLNQVYYDVGRDYIHRIGRTARAGKNGEAITILCERDYDNFRNVLSDKKLEIKSTGVPKVPSIRFDRNLIQQRSMGTRRRNGGGFSAQGGFERRNNFGSEKSSNFGGNRSGNYRSRSSSGPSDKKRSNKPNRRRRY